MSIKASISGHEGPTAISEAAASGHVVIIEQLHTAGADIRGRDRALNHAAYRGHLEGVKVLLAAGADVNEPDQYGEPPLVAAAMDTFQWSRSFLRQEPM
jgi:uncharacterized protein